MNSLGSIQPVVGKEAPSIDALVARARSFIPMLQEASPQNEANRRVSADIIKTLNDAGLLDLMKPARFGGREWGPSAVIRVVFEIGRGCGSTGWCAMLANISSWFVSYWPLEAQQDIWDENPDALVCGLFVPSGKAEVVDGGYRISGKWPYASNCENSDWYYVSCMVPDAETGDAFPGLFLTPAASLNIDQSSWHVSGLAGSGSKTLYAEEPVFVPAHRMIKFHDIHSNNTPGQKLPDNPMSRFWFSTFGASGLVSPLLGMAQGALDWYGEAMQKKVRVAMKPGAAGTSASSPSVQQRAGFASGAIQSALALVLRDLESAEVKIFAGEELSQTERVNIRRNFGFCALQAREAVDSLMLGAGSSGSELDKPIQRFWRDINAGARHVSLDVEGINTMVGQDLFGLPVIGTF